MPHKTASRLRELLEQLQRAQHESGDVAEQARQDLAGAISSGELRPVGTAGAVARKKKAGKKKR
ncbi:MAG TPA: hypothetical protein VFZ36_02050 [Vicinamibacterales bacterium]